MNCLFVSTTSKSNLGSEGKSTNIDYRCKEMGNLTQLMKSTYLQANHLHLCLHKPKMLENIIYILTSRLEEISGNFRVFMV